MSDPIQGLTQGVRPSGLPDDAEPFSAVNATDITTTTKQTIKAGVVGKKHYITQAVAYNKTTTEDQILMIRHGTTDIAILHPADVADAHGDHGKQYNFDPPLQVPAGVDVDGIGVIAAVGDCVIALNGYVGS